MKNVVLLSMVLCVSPAFAADLPLPTALVSATTAYVANGGVNQDYFERLILELREWNRFTLVDDKATADITITLDGNNTIGHVAFVGAVRAVEYRITFRSGEETLYSDQLKGCCSFKAMVSKTLDKLKKRMEPREQR
jgi:hypothetical protein